MDKAICLTCAGPIIKLQEETPRYKCTKCGLMYKSEGGRLVAIL